jgi:hypothetical protein
MITACNHNGFVVTFDSSDSDCPVCHSKQKTLQDFTYFTPNQIEELEDLFTVMLHVHGFTVDDTMVSVKHFINHYNPDNDTAFN